MVRKARRDSNDIIRALRRYAELYGPDFTAASFSPSSAKWNDRPELAERYFAGDPATGEPWPSLNSIKAPFGGSFNEAKRAAGLPINRPGPSKGKRAPGTAAPIRDVRHETRTVYVEKDGDETLRRLQRAEARAARLAARVAALEARPVPKPAPKTKIKIETKTVKVTDAAAVRRAETRVEKAEAKLTDLRDELKTARMDVAEARQAATRSASKLERAEATISELRDERRALKAAVGRAEDRVTAAEAERERLAAREPERVVVHEESPEAAIVRRAEREAREAEVRAARAEREYAELAVAVKGERRKLTSAEIVELRKLGPAGPELVKRAVAAYIKAGRNPTALRAALTELASAAVSYRERL